MIIDLLEPVASLEELELAVSLHQIERLQIAQRAFPASPALLALPSVSRAACRCHD